MPPEVPRVPPLGLFTCSSLSLIFLSPYLSPSRVIISRPNSSRKPSQITGSCCEPLILKLPPHTLSIWLSCCFLVVSCFCLSLQLNCKLLKRKRERAISFTPFVPLGSFTPRQELVSARQAYRSGKTWDMTANSLSLPLLPSFAR